MRVSVHIHHLLSPMQNSIQRRAEVPLPDFMSRGCKILQPLCNSLSWSYFCKRHIPQSKISHWGYFLRKYTVWPFFFWPTLCEVFFSIYLPSAERISDKKNNSWWIRTLFKSNRSGLLNPASSKHAISHLSPLLANFSEMLLIIILKPKVLAFYQSVLNQQCVALSAYLSNCNSKDWKDALISSENSSIGIWNSLPTLVFHP